MCKTQIHDINHTAAYGTIQYTMFSCVYLVLTNVIKRELINEHTPQKGSGYYLTKTLHFTIDYREHGKQIANLEYLMAH